MIEGVHIKPLKIFSDEKGKVLHMLRCNDSFFKQFGEVYFSLVNPGFIKGWKKHLNLTQHFAAPVGNIQLVVYDDREDSPTKGEIQEISIGTKNYLLVRIPPLVWYSFKATGNEPALVANCTDLPHNPGEVINLELFDKKIPYKWNMTDE